MKTDEAKFQELWKGFKGNVINGFVKGNKVIIKTKTK